MQVAGNQAAKQSRNERNLKKLEKSTWQMKSDMLRCKSCVMNGQPGAQRQLKKVWKNLKKFLTNEISCANI